MSLPLAEFNAFHGVGFAFAAWAVIVGVLGVRMADFPRSQGAQRFVVAVSAILLVATVTAAVATSEKHEHGSSHTDRANPTHEGEPPENLKNE